MTRTEIIRTKITEYTILKNLALKVEDWFLAEYYENLTKELLHELFTLI